ncbi:MAG: PD-(D/E)XK nuclease family protein [Anaerolineales bacterium]
MTDQIIQNNSSDEFRLLDALLIDNPELERIESLLEQFNIFEALGAVWIELRHSDFLAFILNPYQNHGLGDSVVKSFLQRALAYAKYQQIPFRPIYLDVCDLDDLLVLREWQNIDITLIDERNQFIAIIENKIRSGEHSEQLTRYRKIVELHYPGWRKLYLFLTPDGDEPSDPEYIPIDYNLVVDLVEKISDTRSSIIGPDILTLLTHYSQMLRRYIVSESEIADLCRKIYRKHQRALDLIYEYRPDKQGIIHDILDTIISENSDMELDFSSKSYVRFLPKKWDVLKLKHGEGWTRSGRMLMYEFQNNPNSLALHLVIGPGPLDIREKLYSMAKQNDCFRPFRALGSKWNTIFRKFFLSGKDYDEDDIEVLESIIKKKWTQFLEQDLPAIDGALKAQIWIWEE